MTCRAANPRDCAAPELKAEIARLRDQNSSLLATNYDLRKERDRMTDELAEARTAIRDLCIGHGDACLCRGCRVAFRTADRPDSERRPCTCPDGERPIPCQRKFALHDCQQAAGWPMTEDQPADADAEARALFYSTRNGHGWTAPEWDELAEETRQNYREFVARRAADKSNPLDMEPGPGGSRVLVVKEK